jgi:hypothetical protein
LLQFLDCDFGFRVRFENRHDRIVLGHIFISNFCGGRAYPRLSSRLG